LSQQVFLLSEFLETRAPEWEPPRLRRRALVQGHCHQKALMGLDAELAVLEKLGMEVEVLDSGCCGMAGSFGFEREKYAFSMKAGERVLLPAVRQAAADTLVVANGFSCREQIAQGAGRRALHLAEAIQMAMQQAGRAPAAAYALGGLALSPTTELRKPRWRATGISRAPRLRRESRTPAESSCRRGGGRCPHCAGAAASALNQRRAA
jgi:hypothetical protein